jgi:cell division protein FtsI (penicillin-binding protein 3)
VIRPPLKRLVTLFCVIVLALAVIVVRLAVLQVGQAGAYQTKALDQRVHTIAISAARGLILDRNGEALALSVEARDIYADPRYVTDPWGTAVRLAPVLGLDVRSVAEQLATDTTFVYVARQVDLDVATHIEHMHLPGIGFLPVSKRYYPAGPLASQLLGFVGVDGAGLAGLELEYQGLLAGTAGERTQEIGLHGEPIAGGIDVERPSVPGSTVETTIDRDFQYQAQVALEEAVQANHARGGTVIAMNPQTGDIYAIATYPWFDPNDFVHAPPNTEALRALTDAFEPGSTNKVITAAAAVQEHVVPLDERLTVPWTVRVGDFTIHDSQAHAIEHLTLGDIIAQSSNVGTVQIAQRLGQARLATYLSRFGLGRTTGVGFPGEASGIMLPLYQWSDTSFATMAYGQGIAVTPLQMLSVFATIANDGRRVQPRLIEGTIGPDGEHHAAAAAPGERVVSADTALMVRRMLAYAVEAGTGRNAQIAGYQVAGKTGTAQIPLPDRAGYAPGQYFASFIGMVPAAEPQIVIAAILDRPATEYGGIAAAPLFRQVARYAIARLAIEPGRVLEPPPHALPLP